MAKQYYTIGAVINYLMDSKVTESIKITQFQQFDFNSMEGNQITFNVNVTTKEGYKNKRISVFTNSSYFQWYEIEETAEAVKEFLNNLNV